ncbi:hypothetical protein [Nocardia farcinica]|uniref:hypothetical protein n=1 Tax=Nocardia farcinica TaxID=37329 RepID=UPI0018950499|nr:hypothetical protein [Nocardia farcinica]MBF6185072.1 hypothetical protein [Nocardia farcinica]MBF6363960.1 hypothetical protein [Nocardia farcinica]
MGFFKKQRDEFGDMNYYFKIGCEVLGPPRGGPLGMGTPLERADRVKAGKAEAARRAQVERAAQFGAGEAYGDRNWTAPVHASTRDGRPVTVSFGLGPRDGQTLICDGHVNAAQFYEKKRDGLKGHDHYLIDGRPAGPRGDRGRYTDQ